MSFSPAQLVNPYIGTISQMLQPTVPEVMLPYSYIRSYPRISGKIDYYCSDTTAGFPAGTALWLPSQDGTTLCSAFDHARETVHCYESEIVLEEPDDESTAEVTVKSTVTRHCYVYSVENAASVTVFFPEGSRAEVKDGRLCLFVKATAQKQFADEYVSFYADRDYTVSALTETSAVLCLSGKTEFYLPVSFISAEQAEINYQKEIGETHLTFAEISAQAKKTWDALLGKIRVEGNTEDKQIIFYTALYRAFQRMTNYAEFGRYYSGYDHQVHEGEFFYTNDGLWDTFRCMHPLQLLLDPENQKNIVESYNLMYRQGGIMPSFPQAGGDAPVMLGFHAAALFADCAAKGLDVDYETAYEGIYKNATEQSMLPWVTKTPAEDLDRCYYEKGFFPALKYGEEEDHPSVHPFERRQALSVTLEHCFDDWCAGQLAHYLGKEEDYAFFSRRAKNYRTLFNKDLSLMAPKEIDGNWVTPYDPKWSGGMGGRAYTAENNTYVYTWSVFHDLPGLIELMGGKKEASRNLDRLFTERFTDNRNKFDFLGQFPDSTGLMGQFTMGNEPAFHIPYLYDYCGKPWKTQRRLRDLMDIWFLNQPTGICGDEDGGAMSSWFVFSAMGFYPVCPGSGEYAVGTPLFDRAEIDLGGGKTLSIRSEGAGSGLRYIRDASLNGRKLTRPFLSHRELMEGGELVFVMDRVPNKAWPQAE